MMTEPFSAAMKSPLRRLRLPLALLLVLGAALGGAWWWEEARFHVSTDNAYVAGDIAPLSARIEGDVAEVLVADNSRVTAGQPLIRLEQQDWLARRDAARAAVEGAEAQLATLAAQQGQARSQIAAAEAQLASAQAERERATLEANRFGSLAASGTGSREAAERTLADRRKAEAGVTLASANLANARAALPVLAAQIEAATASRDQASANLRLAENNLSYTVIRAPFDGIVANRAAQVGQHVRSGLQLVSVAPPPERTWLVANFKETQLAAIRPGQPVRVTLDVTGEVLEGHVEALAPATGALFSLLPPENATGNFTRVVQRVPVRIAFDRPAQGLRPGLSATAEVDTRAPGEPANRVAALFR
jgi:membrane fusion protein (multidrug efflux system)